MKAAPIGRRTQGKTAISAGVAARQAAINTISAVLRENAPLERATAEMIDATPLDLRDRGFARALATESFRRLGQIEALIRQFVPKAPAPHKAGITPEILIAGACELLFLGIPAHAAVDAANRLAQADRNAVHFKPLINAVLRRIAREGRQSLAAQDASALNTPDWLWARWLARYGEDVARAIATAHLAVPPLDLSFAEIRPPAVPGATQLAPGRLRVNRSRRVEEIAGYRDGLWWVQDFAASLPARLLGDVTDRRVLDLCAAPGGKTAQFCAGGAQVTAVDISADRLQLLRENLDRLRFTANLVATDIRDWRPAEPAPFVFLDAPCTATGTIRRHPDLPWLKSAADVEICAGLQQELLDSAAQMTASGGLLVYAVCSLEPEECEEQVEFFLQRNTRFRREPATPAESFDELFITAGGDLQTLPSYWAEKGGMDGFFAARMRYDTQAE
jgi:16S rRNA (cytosine967-C5)-methyltransferase